MKKITLVFLSVLVLLIPVSAEELTSDKYKANLNITTGGEETESAKYSTLFTFGAPLADARFDSANYTLKGGLINTFQANVPKVLCFEAISDGTTECTNPNITPSGMVMLCGDGGCYDRARFEIDAQNNPADTLYAVQIKKAIDVDWSFLDGSTFTIENSTTHDLNDYKTKEAWENSGDFNIIGLEIETEYQLGITALHGDLTESGQSPLKSTMTGVPTISFDIDIASGTGSTTDTDGPHSIDLSEISNDFVSTASDKVWFDIGTNAIGGGELHSISLNGGLYSIAYEYLIPSISGDLASVPEGFGLVEYSSSQEFLGPLVATTNYANLGNPDTTRVGIVEEMTSRVIYNTSAKPIAGGRGAVNLKYKASGMAPAGYDYFDELTFLLVSTF